MSTPKFCECGCGEQTKQVRWADKARGLKNGDYQPFVRGHHRRVTAEYKVSYIVDEITGCWNWAGNIHKVTGYGSCRRVSRHGSRCPTPHHYYYEQHREAVPKGLELDHTCKNKSCVNPDHLEVVTTTVNMRRRTFCKLDMEKAREIRAKYLGGTTKAALSREYGVAFMSITYIIRTETWQEGKE